MLITQLTQKVLRQVHMALKISYKSCKCFGFPGDWTFYLYLCEKQRRSDLVKTNYIVEIFFNCFPVHIYDIPQVETPLYSDFCSRRFAG